MLASLFENGSGLAVSAFDSAERLLASLEAAEAPEVALVDLGLPGMSGLDLIDLLKERWPDLDIVVHTIPEERESVFSAILSGASGYLLKGASPEELLEGIASVRQGGAPMTPKIARAVIREFQRERTISDREALTFREREILGQVAEGLAYKEIADCLHLSVHTVHTHLKRIYRKLHVKSKREAIIRARTKGMI